MLESLSGRAHRVFSAVALVAGARQAMRVQQSSVWFRSLPREDCAAYWDTGEPRDKAGGYAIQGRAAAFISRLEGSYSGVMGLPLFETAKLLRDFGVVNTWIPSGRTA
jgi:septum formation protein